MFSLVVQYLLEYSWKPRKSHPASNNRFLTFKLMAFENSRSEVHNLLRQVADSSYLLCPTEHSPSQALPKYHLWRLSSLSPNQHQPIKRVHQNEYSKNCFFLSWPDRSFGGPMARPEQTPNVVPQRSRIRIGSERKLIVAKSDWPRPRSARLWSGIGYTIVPG